MNFARLQAVYKSFGMEKIQVKVGQLLEIHETIGEGDNKRTRKFKCLVYGVNNPSHPNGTFLVRGVTSWIVVEKIYPLCFEKFAKVILLDEFKVRRAKLYFLRDKVGKDARLKSIITSDRRNTDLLTLKIVHTDANNEVAPELIDVVEEVTSQVSSEEAPSETNN